ncbi:MAG TPA: DUF58 domain-containing protein [Rhodothermales bacterium]|nr:DUF58 domain-containing protein [Rhodothermales bacterium]
MIPRELFSKIRRIEIRTKGLVNNTLGGEYHSAFKGRGMEFAEVRPYQVGDDIRSIDWNVSARTGETYVKIFEEEREQTLMLLVDVSGSEDFGSQTRMKREIAAEISALLAFSAVQNNDKVGMLLFSDKVELFVPPKKGRRHVLRLIRDLFAHEQQSRGTSLSVALDHVLRVLHRRSIVLLISDFLDRDFEKSLRAVANRHDTIALELVDPREVELPPIGLVHLIDTETGETVVLDTRNRHTRYDFSDRSIQHRAEIADLFKRLRLDNIQIKTGEDYAEPLIQFFRRRTRAA